MLTAIVYLCHKAQTFIHRAKMTGLSYFKQYPQVVPLTNKGHKIRQVLLSNKQPDERNKIYRQLPVIERQKVSDMWTLMHKVPIPDEVINSPELQCGFDIE